LSHADVFEAGRKVERRLAGLITRLAPRIMAGMAAGAGM